MSLNLKAKLCDSYEIEKLYSYFHFKVYFYGYYSDECFVINIHCILDLKL